MIKTMRPLEVTIPALLAVYLLWPYPRPLLIRYLPAFALIIILIHLFIERFRWQMIPLYAMTLILTVSTLLIRDMKFAASFLTLILLLLSTALPVLLPVPKIPTPSGPFPVGTVIYEFKDTTRKELYSGKDEARRFMIQTWYPANINAADERAQWMSNAKMYARAIATYTKRPSFFFDHLALVHIPAYKNAQVAQTDGSHPVIIFSHGWNGFNAQNTTQALELASHGYIVIGIQHTYGAVVTVFPDGTVASNNPKTLPETVDDPNYAVTARKLVNQWAGDISFTLEQFDRLNKDPQSIFFQRLDMERIGVYGHSTGAGAAIQFCGTDSRCKAVLGMDPFMAPVSAEVITNGISQPSFFMFSQGWAEPVDSRNNQSFDQFYSKVSASKGAVIINGTKHYDFSDVALLSPIAPQLGLKGPLNGKRVTQIVNSYLLDFFKITLDDKPSKLFDGTFDDFNEVKMRQQ